jgi:hypothetical protein
VSGYKVCRSCGEEKPRAQFAMPHGKPSNICKPCYTQAQLTGGLIEHPRPQASSSSRSDRSPRMKLNVHGDTSGDTYQLWQDLMWKRKIAEASQAELVWEEQRRERQKVL